jgi:hypothetical protein
MLASLLQGFLLAALVATGLLLILFGLVQAVFVTVCLLLPALVPLFVVGVGILGASEFEIPNDTLAEMDKPASFWHGAGV